MRIQEQFSKALLEAVQETFAKVLSTEFKPVVLEAAPPTAEFITSVKFSGEVEGVLAIGFSNETACLVVSKILDKEFKQVNKEVADGLGRILGLVVEAVKVRLKDNASISEVTLPIIINQQMLEASSKEFPSALYDRFTSEAIEFNLMAFLKILKPEAVDKAEAAVVVVQETKPVVVSQEPPPAEIKKEEVVVPKPADVPAVKSENLLESEALQKLEEVLKKYKEVSQGKA